ncbi:MAG TPA: CHRD domain-containing protein, partial [Steroidobacteraceae bacterium]|nr:CHRD domain-containing protein [Steroidobacteraceae bacterium]
TLAALSGTVNRTVTLTATPNAPNGVLRVDFLVDNSVIGMATAAPYTTTWDTGRATDGAHNVIARVTDNMNLTGDSTLMSVTVANNMTITVSLSASEEFPVPTSTATGTGQLAVNVATGVISGNFTVSGMTATAAHIHDAFAGNAGGILIGFNPNGSIANRWDLPTTATLTSAQVDRLLGGALYVNAHSTAFPAGEIRSQIKPTGVRVVYANLTGTQEVPPVTTTATGIAAITVDSNANKLAVHEHATGVDNSTASHIHRGATGVTGPIVFNFTKDSTDPGHWSLEGQALGASDLTDFTSNNWYVNIHTPANPTGEIRGQVIAQTTAATTLTQLQTTIFTPICTSCHNGTGTSLPGSMDLRAGQSFASLVNVASVEQSTVKRVNPNNATASYIVQKLQGDATITGVRMPQFGPYLDQATIDTVKSWINAGALNN